MPRAAARDDSSAMAVHVGRIGHIPAISPSESISSPTADFPRRRRTLTAITVSRRRAKIRVFSTAIPAILGPVPDSLVTGLVHDLSSLHFPPFRVGRVPAEWSPAAAPEQRMFHATVTLCKHSYFELFLPRITASPRNRMSPERGRAPAGDEVWGLRYVKP